MYDYSLHICSTVISMSKGLYKQAQASYKQRRSKD